MKQKYNAQILTLILLALMIAGRCNAQITTKQIAGHGIKHPDIVLAQIKLETGNLKCTNCSLQYNNYFGFHNGKRYLKYDNLEHCLEGYKSWQEWRCPNCKTKGDYYNCLVKYWGAPMMDIYIQKLKDIQL